ncbi:Fe-S cluster assembly protein SufD [Aliidiomarina quisquiliarum]|uniref:Fe-S cluster assembly protein SufD n=1 Tax=Aliidiomarina quisquiliarum TaxID=2938947 RepID=UPI00208E35C6|nr:Fe-S cluster assembly protein SufD [Aliidiomarina quisquiliarum]MCO4320554.1 Fe-S cluster assembly protein SufD [Aliidiomarina quisquiliarum]
MSQWLANVIDRASSVNDWLSPVRQEALTRLKSTSWPTRRTEEWRYTSLHALANLTLNEATNSKALAEAPVVSNLNSIDIVFVDGVPATDLTALNLPAGLTIHSLANASEAIQQQASKVFNQVKPDAHLFGLVNDALALQGVFINVAAGVQLEQPIRVVNLVSAGIESHNRVLVNLGANAQATIIEHGAGQGNSMNTAFAEYVIGTEAKLEHYRFALHGEEAIHIGGCHFKMGESSRLNSTIVGYGSQISRIDTDVVHAAEHALAKMNCIYLLGPKEHFDLHSLIEHVVPNGTTEQNARGIVGDKARAVFSGRILIHRDAQKTLAELHNRNLLMSRGAQISTTPALEIYADDVQCAHGATIAEIAEEDLYYLQARGISRKQALIMLNFGFIQELVSQMPNKALAAWLEPLLRERFATMESE